MNIPNSGSLADMERGSHFHKVSSIADALNAGPTIYSSADGI